MVKLLIFEYYNKVIQNISSSFINFFFFLISNRLIILKELHGLHKAWTCCSQNNYKVLVQLLDQSKRVDIQNSISQPISSSFINFCIGVGFKSWDTLFKRLYWSGKLGLHIRHKKWGNFLSAKLKLYLGCQY